MTITVGQDRHMYPEVGHLIHGRLGSLARRPAVRYPQPSHRHDVSDDLFWRGGAEGGFEAPETWIVAKFVSPGRILEPFSGSHCTPVLSQF